MPWTVAASLPLSLLLKKALGRRKEGEQHHRGDSESALCYCEQPLPEFSTLVHTFLKPHLPGRFRLVGVCRRTGMLPLPLGLGAPHLLQHPSPSWVSSDHNNTFPVTARWSQTSP